MDPKTLGEMAYEAYGQTTDFKNFMGNPMPKWHELPDKIREAWENAALKIFSINQNASSVAGSLNKVRAKCIVSNVSDSTYCGDPAKRIELAAVFEGTPNKDGNQCEENKIFGKYTPCMRVDMLVTNPSAYDQFNPGKIKYLDFIDAE